MPQSITKTYTVYQFDELNDKAKEKARDWFREASAGDSYAMECVIDDAKAIGALMGITITNVFYRGFWSQGDGACFEGRYEYEKASVTKVKEYAPLDTELHRIATALRVLQGKHFYKLSAYVKHSGRYYHEQCTTIDVRKDGGYFFDTDDSYVRDSTHDGAQAVILLRDFMKWIYKRLEEAYEFENKDETIEENILANEYTFTETGKRCD